MKPFVDIMVRKDSVGVNSSKNFQIEFKLEGRLWKGSGGQPTLKSDGGNFRTPKINTINIPCVQTVVILYSLAEKSKLLNVFEPNCI